MFTISQCRAVWSPKVCQFKDFHLTAKYGGLKFRRCFDCICSKMFHFFLVLVTDLKGKPLTRCKDHPQTFRLSTINSYATLMTNCPNFGPYTKCIVAKGNNLSCHLNK